GVGRDHVDVHNAGSRPDASPELSAAPSFLKGEAPGRRRLRRQGDGNNDRQQRAHSRHAVTRKPTSSFALPPSPVAWISTRYSPGAMPASGSSICGSPEGDAGTATGRSSIGWPARFNKRAVSVGTDVPAP